MDKLTRAARIYKYLFGKSGIKIAWMIVFCGVILIAPPLLAEVINYFTSKNLNYHIIGDYDWIVGLILVLIGVIYHIIITYLSRKGGDDNSITNIIEGPIVFPGNGSASIQQGNGNVTYNNCTILNYNGDDQEAMQKLLEALQKNKDKITRTQAFSTSTFFMSLFKRMPWVQDIQIVTYLKTEEELLEIKYLTSHHTISSFYVRVHESFDFNSHQIQTPEQITSIKNSIVEAIYWEKYGMWTLNTFDHFVQRNLEMSIDLENAVANDISSLLGDVTYMVNDINFNLVYSSLPVEKYTSIHSKYGYLISTNIVRNSKEIPLEPLEFAILDSFVKLQVGEVNNIDKMKTHVNESSSSAYLIKVSSLLLRTFAQYNVDVYNENTIGLKVAVIELMKKIEIPYSFQIPRDKNSRTDILFRDAFGNSKLLDEYNKSK